MEIHKVIKKSSKNFQDKERLFMLKEIREYKQVSIHYLDIGTNITRLEYNSSRNYNQLLDWKLQNIYQFLNTEKVSKILENSSDAITTQLNNYLY